MSEQALGVLLVGLPLVPLFLTVVNLFTWRRARLPKSAAGTAFGPGSVSLLVPARNEEANLEPLLSSALAQGRVLLEVLVYDDSSTDGTAALVERFAVRDARVRLLRGVPLPDGWVGKPHACQRLLEDARGEIVCFVDADVRLEPRGLERLLTLLEPPARGRVVTAVPRQEAQSFFERLILPLLVLTYTAWLPLRAVEWGRGRSTVAANGQLLCLRRADALALGGFSAVRSEIVDDVAFCRNAKAGGLRVVFADGFEVARCRMYRGARHVIAGFSKNLYEGLGGRPTTLAFVLALYLGCFVLPYAALFSSALLAPSPNPYALPALLGVAANVTLRALLAVRFRQPLEGILLHPLAVLALVGIALNSARWNLRRRIEWSGRSYLPRGEREART